MRVRDLWFCAIAALVLGAGASPAWAVDGVIEINQARAEHGGVTATDQPGFPITIDAGGSYRLTSNLHVPATTSVIAKSAIQIMVGGTPTPLGVTLDLNGFTIDAAQTGDLILVVSGIGLNLTVRNGTLNGGGIQANGGAFDSLFVEGVSVDGIDKSHDGIRSSGRCTIRDCRIRQCFDGIAPTSGTVVDCTVTDCGRGITAASGAIVSRCSATLCGTGIVSFGGTVSGCLVTASNGTGTSDAGISVQGEGSLIIGNEITGGAAPGIFFFNPIVLSRALLVDNIVNRTGGTPGTPIKLNGQSSYAAPVEWHGNMLIP